MRGGGEDGGNGGLEGAGGSTRLVFHMPAQLERRREDRERLEPVGRRLLGPSEQRRGAQVTPRRVAHYEELAALEVVMEVVVGWRWGLRWRKRWWWW